ncbi:outer membrane protein assembly factor BamE [Limnobacter sp.]|uniref:outer membrane protein assembly factor BamE n=1 Tax=Limnobacter sp. TaxID=2003368 RepID=UPI00258BA3C3|nr:outer membrane protein assembly factor BamE [Limnobacter sp.]
MRILRLNLLLGALLTFALAGCSSMTNYVPSIIKPYKFDIQQGNYVTQADIDRVKIGMTKDQVKYILGTPLLNDAFHANRWDYVYRLKKADGQVYESRYTVIFDGDKLVKKGGENVPENADPVLSPVTQSKPAAKPEPTSQTQDQSQVTGTERAPVLK